MSKNEALEIFPFKTDVKFLDNGKLNTGSVFNYLFSGKDVTGLRIDDGIEYVDVELCDIITIT